VYALNLKLSPENSSFWVRADPFILGAGKTECAFKTSANCPPGVSDSIELYNGMQATRQATSKGSWGNVQCSTRV